MKKKLVLCEHNKVEFDNEHYGNSLEDIATSDWDWNIDCNQKELLNKYSALFLEKRDDETNDAPDSAEEVKNNYNICIKRLDEIVSSFE